ncbi:MAG: hypothetical protein QF858_01510 [Candidatus Pacebacteria bacterium]|jgi:hypothetical protein|nr:hypothetical protein [Candidatus Paceibacterota bacterium]|tara:strand:- start:1587 stop:2021 length:435 start_codon:yes stop_codon:yes gene_type:complete
MFGLPVEMITMLSSSVLGGVMTIWGQSIKAKQAEQKMLLARGKFQMESIEAARKYENAGFQWTRRIIALTAVFFIIVWPKIVPVFFDVSVFLTWTELSRGFFFLIEQKELLVDRKFAGVVITPMDTHLMAAIVGLYFGGSLVKK